MKKHNFKNGEVVKGLVMDVVVKASKKANSIDAVFSTADPDRHGDIVMQNWDLDNFKKNPVILNSHNSYDATEVIGRAGDIEVVDNKLQGTIEFAVDANPKAKVIYELYAGGFLSAFSVGFIIKEMSDMGVILKSELLEISAVSVPANAFALAKSKGIDVSAIEKDVVGEEESEEQEDEEVQDEKKENEENEEAEEDNEETIVEETEDGDGEDTEDDDIAAEDATTKLLNAVKALREENKGRNLEDQRKKEMKRMINKAIRGLLEEKSKL